MIFLTPLKNRYNISAFRANAHVLLYTYVLRAMVFVVFILSACQLFAVLPTPVSNKTASDFLQERGEVYFSFSLSADDMSSEDILRELSNNISVDYYTESRVFAYASEAEFADFLARQLDYQVHIPPGLMYADKNIQMRSSVLIDEIESWNFYPTYQAYESMMEQFAAGFPELCELVELATSPGGRKILFVKLGKNNDIEPGTEPAGKPRFMYTATMHGDETIGFNLMLRLIHYLLNEYGSNPYVTHLMDELEIWICPNENPDGTFRNGNSTVVGSTRFNRNNIDLNRNYPRIPDGFASNLQPETRAMMRLTDSLDFVMSANIHGGIECVNYPWDNWVSSQRKHADHDWWYMVSREFADTARFYSHHNYMNPVGGNFIRGVTHGGDWYVVERGRQDYMNYYANQRELTLELSNIKVLPTDSLDNHWEYNYRSLLNYMNQATFGIRGHVRDLAASRPVQASIELRGHDKDNSQVFSDSANGQYYRPVQAGTYEMYVRAEGYPDYSFDVVRTQSYQSTSIDIDLGMFVFDQIHIDFEPTVPNRTSMAWVKVTNNTDEYLYFHRVEIIGDQAFNADAIVIFDKQSGYIPPLSTDSILMVFWPDSPGDYAADCKLYFYSGIIYDLDPAVTISLAGHAMDSAAFLYVHDWVLFYDVPLTHSKELQAFVANMGNVPLIVTNTFVTGTAFEILADFPVTIEPNKVFRLPLIFTPDSARLYIDTLTFVSNAYNNEYTKIYLWGTGDPAISVAQRNINTSNVSIFPNPVIPESVVTMQLKAPGMVGMQLLGTDGRVYHNWPHQYAEAGLYMLHFGSELPELIPGVYVLVASTPEGTVQIKCVIL